MTVAKPIVAIHHDRDGFIRYLVPDEVTLLVIDDSSVYDRVYRYDTTTSPEQVAALVGDSPIGHSGDGQLSDDKEQAIQAATWRARGHGLELVPAGPVEDE